MELMLLVYFVENLSYNGTFFGTWGGIFAFILCICICIKAIVVLHDDELSFKMPFKLLVTFTFICATLHTILPERQTMIYMVGAYAAQEVLTSKKAEELGDKTYKALSNQLDKWADEVPELKEIVTKKVVSTVKEKVSEELTK